MLWEQPGAGAVDVLGQPLPVGERDEPVLTALPDRHRQRDRLQVEAPVPNELKVIVEPAIDAAADRGRE